MLEDGAVPKIVARDDRRTPRESGDAVIAEIVASGREVLRKAGVDAKDVVAGGCWPRVRSTTRPAS